MGEALRIAAGPRKLALFSTEQGGAACGSGAKGVSTLIELMFLLDDEVGYIGEYMPHG